MRTGSGRVAWEQRIVRLFVVAAFVTATSLTIILDVSKPLPAIALQTEIVFHIERALVIFYGALLMILPLVRGVIRGELPIEISPRGARYQEVALESKVTSTELETTVHDLERAGEGTADLLRDTIKRVDALETDVRGGNGEAGR